MFTAKKTSGINNVFNANRRAALIVLALLAAPVVTVTTGCGGGGAGKGNAPIAAPLPGESRGDAPATPAEPSGPFQPNFHAELQVARRWEKRNVLVHIDAASASAASYDRAEAVKMGMNLWGPATNNLFNVAYTDDASVADIKVSFVPAGSLTQGQVGKATVTFRNEDQVIVRSTIRIDEALNAETTAQVAAHELGHALGMSGHSTDGADLMFTHTHLPVVVTRRDANTLLYAYSDQNPAATGDAAAATRSTKSGTTTTTTEQAVLCDRHRH